MGNSTRVCSVVNATTVPIVIACPPEAMLSPANQYTAAGMIAKLICTEAMRQRPAMRVRTSSSASSRDSPPKRRTSSGARPIVLPSRMPDTDSDSSTSVDMSASRPWRTDWMRRRCSPTRRVSHTKNGSKKSENAARRQSSRIMATTTATTVVTFWTIEVAVEVTTLSMPPMSFAMRDCTSPVRVRVKKASDMRCRCAYTDARRSCMTRWPTWFEIHVCATPITLVVIDSTIIPATSSVSSVVSRCG